MHEYEKPSKLSELEATLQNLTPAEVEQRRSRMFGLGTTGNYGHRYRMDSIASDGFDSPGNMILPIIWYNSDSRSVM